MASFSKFQRSLILFVCAFLGACSSAPKTTPELSRMEGKRVALVSLEGEPTARAVVEVALINQLLKHGSFEIVSKSELDKARAAADLDPTDWKGLASRVKADFALRGDIQNFTAETQDGYSEEAIEDSQLKAERGDGKTKRLIKVRQMEGHVAVLVRFTELKTDDTREAVAEARETVSSEGRQGPPRLPAKLTFLQKLAGEAFEKFFSQYQ